MPIPELRLLVRSTIVRYLACGSDTSRNHLLMLEYFRSCGQGVFSEEVLSQILDEFPQELTDDLLIVLSPPHLRHLQLTNCSRISCSGLQKALAKCQQIEALDFGHCIHLLHPTVFLSIRDKAPKLVSLSFENSEVVSDDIVQVALICCPGLKHLNLSSCQNITDEVFFLPHSTNIALVPESKTIMDTSHSKHSPGRNLTSVDISGCNSLSTMAVRHLVDLCGPSLTTLNLSWTGVGCTALLHLAGLSLEEVARIVREADSACPVLLEMPLSEEQKQICHQTNAKDDHYDKGEELSQECDRSYKVSVDTTRSSQKDGNNTEVLQSFSRSCVLDQDVPHNYPTSYSCFERNCEAVGSSEQHGPTFVTSSIRTKSERIPDRLSTRLITDVASVDDLVVGHDTVVPGITHLPLADGVCSISFQNRTDSYGSHFSASDGSDVITSVSKCRCTFAEENDLYAICHALDLEATALCSELLELDDVCTKPDTQTNTVSSFSAAVSRLSWALSDLMSNEDSSGYTSDDKLPNASRNISPGNQTLLFDDSTAKASCDSHDTLVHDGGITSTDGKETANVKEVISLSPNCPAAEKSIVTQCLRVQSSVDVQTSVSEEIPSRTQERFLCKEHFNEQETSLEGKRQRRFQHEESEDSSLRSALVWSSEIESDDERNKCSDGVEDDSPTCSCSLNVPSSKGAVPSTQDRSYITLEQESFYTKGLFKSENSADNSRNDRSGEKICWSRPEHGQISSSKTKDSTCIVSNFMASSAPDQGRKEPGIEAMAHTYKVRGTQSNAIRPLPQDIAVKESDSVSILPVDSCDSVIVCKEEINETHKTGSFSKETEHSKPRRSLLTAADILVAQAYQPRIFSLDISNIYYHSKPLGMACLRIFFQANKCLKKFSISWSELDDTMFRCLLQNEADLESLSLVDCDKLTNLSLISIPLHCPKLSSIDLKGVCFVTDHGVTPLTGSNNLERLSLAEAAIGDSTLENVAKSCGPRMKELDLSWCEDVTDRGLSAVASSCSALQFLGMRQCSVGQDTLYSLATTCHFMTSLNIAGIDTLTDKMLGSLARNMPLLMEVDVSWNSSLTDSGIAALLLHCCKLKEAVLNGLKFITSTPFLSIIADLQRWHLLEELWKNQKKPRSVASKGRVAFKVCNLETAKSLGDQIPFRSLTYAPSLRHMTLEYSDKVNDDHLAAIVAVCRGTLRVVDYYAQSIEPHWIFR